ncbi:MAG: hypothetical protein IKW06_06385 [Clostridia bacterium]|nr:hypothetical protein [Clostridia bacterium]
MIKERNIPQHILCDPETLLELKQNETFFSGRIVKLFRIKKKILLQVISNGKKYKCRIEDTINNYGEIATSLQIGDVICGFSEETKTQFGECEFLLTSIHIVAPCLLKENDTGLLPNNPFTNEKKKQFFHSYITSDDICSLRIIAQDRIMQSLRNVLQENGYIECLTPVLQKNFFGGNARPFVTHVVDSGEDVYLRITSEIALKHYIAGGFNKVYELGYYFRNGNITSKSIVPYSAAEIYTAYSSEPENLALIKKIFKSFVSSLEEILADRNIEINPCMKKDIKTISFSDYFRADTGLDFLTQKEQVKALLHEAFKYDINDENYIKEIYKYFKTKIITKQIEPVIVSDLPAGISPLIQNKNEHFLYRSYLIVNGATLMESSVGKTNADELEAILARQKAELNEKGRQEKRDFTAFLHAHYYGMPTTTGLFIGLDRVFPAILEHENIGEYHMKM